MIRELAHLWARHALANAVPGAVSVHHFPLEVKTCNSVINVSHLIIRKGAEVNGEGELVEVPHGRLHLPVGAGLLFADVNILPQKEMIKDRKKVFVEKKNVEI